MADDEDEDGELRPLMDILEDLFEEDADAPTTTHTVTCEHGIVKYHQHSRSIAGFFAGQLNAELIVKEKIEEILETDPNMTLEELKHYEDVLHVEIVSYHPARRRGGGKAPLI